MRPVERTQETRRGGGGVTLLNPIYPPDLQSRGYNNYMILDGLEWYTRYIAFS